MRMYEFSADDAVRFANFRQEKYIKRGDELQLERCPYCGGGKKDRYTFSINLKTGQFKCLRASCDVSGNMITLSKDFDFSLGNETDEYYRPKKRFRHMKTPEKPFVPKEPAVKYLESRGISKRTAEKFEITSHKDNNKILVFPFYDDNGKLVFIKYRNTDFKGSGNKEWCEKNCKPILFGMKQCNGFERLVITEGQIDSLSVDTAGINNAVSVPTGANGFTWVPYCFDWVSRFEEIVVFGDFEKGRMTLLDDIRKRFPCRVKRVREKDYRGCKDANEILKKFGPEAVREAVENAEMVPINRVLSLADVESVNIYKLPKLKTGINPLDKTLCGGIPFGIVCLIAGKRGDGKSTFASQLMAQANEQGYMTFAYSGELPNYMYKSWFDFQLSGPSHIIENNNYGIINRSISNANQSAINDWYREKALIYDSRIIESDEKEDLIGCVEKSIMQYGVKVVLIDNLMTAMYIDEMRSSDKYDRQGMFVRKLSEIALRYNVLILLVAHRRKNSFTTDANDEVSGSGDITNLAGLVLSYDRADKKEIDEGKIDESQRKIIIAKNRLFGKLDLKGIVVSYDEKSKRIYSSPGELGYQYGWDVDNWDYDVPADDNPFN